MTAPMPADARVVGFLDLGTTSLRLMVVCVHADHGYRVLSRQKEAVRLGEGEFASGRLQPEAMDRAVQVCRHFAQMAHALGAAEIVAVATSATREARNQRAFVARMREEAGVEFHVITGKEEARLVYLGIVSALHLEDRRALFVDIGGGSTELIVGGQHGHDDLDSAKVGAIRMASLFPPSADGRYTAATYRRMTCHVRDTAVRVFDRLCRFPVSCAFGSSGTIENLVSAGNRLDGPRAGQRDGMLTTDQLGRLVEKLRACTLDERRAFPGLKPDRADIIVGGAAILDVVMGEFRLPAIQVSDRSLRDGMLADYLAREGSATPLMGLSVRERTVLQLGRLCHFDEAHARTVVRLATALFDSACATGLASPDPDAREILAYAAWLHDIGAFLSYVNHAVHGYYMIRHAELLGFDQAQQEMIAATVLRHRKGSARQADVKHTALEPEARALVERLALFLRLAESLDRSHAGLVRDARLAPDGDERAVLTMDTLGECQLECRGVQGHVKAFARTFGRELSVCVRGG